MAQAKVPKNGSAQRFFNHVAHFVIDGGIRSDRRPPSPNKPDALLDPEAIAQSYLHVLQQPRSAWTSELEVRPWVESF